MSKRRAAEESMLTSMQKTTNKDLAKPAAASVSVDSTSSHGMVMRGVLSTEHDRLQSTDKNNRGM